MESICELLGTLLLPGKKTQTMETEMAKAIAFHLITAEFQREVLIVMFLGTSLIRRLSSSRNLIVQFSITTVAQGQLVL